jgi:hypothetical protein
MSAKVYILLNVSNGNFIQVIEALKRQKGVIIADMLEGPPDLIIVVEAPERQKAAEYLMRILDVVDNVFEDILVLPVRESVGEKVCKYREADQGAREALKKEVSSHV